MNTGNAGFTQSKVRKDPAWRSVFCIVILSCVFILAACTAQTRHLENYGQIKANAQVKEAFENYIVNPNMTYYISGPESHPSAIIGIHNTYNLDSRLWKKIFIQQEYPYPLGKKNTLKFYVDGMEQRFRFLLYGFDILDNAANDIGDWYSILEAKTTVRMLDANRVEIPTPPQDLYQKSRKRNIFD
jgi:hypothetical protein